MKIKDTLENLAEKSVSFLDKRMHHLSNQDLNPDIPLNSESDFNRLEQKRMSYCTQGLSGVVGSLGAFVLTLTAAAEGIICAVKCFGNDFNGEDIFANKEYLDVMALFGTGIASAYLTPLFLRFGEKTMLRYNLLKKKTDEYALAHGLKTATVK